LGPGIWNYGSGNLVTRAYKGFPFFTSGITGYVSVNDAVNVMYLLMESQIISERYILVSKNLSFGAFFKNLAALLKVKVPNKEAKPWHLQLFWRLDWLRHKLTGKRRLMSKHNAESAFSKDAYNNEKIKKALDFEFEPIKASMKEVVGHFLKDH